MTPEQFLIFADPLPEPMLLLSSDGLILAGNRAVEERLGISVPGLRGKRLADVVKEPPEEVAHYLRLCRRSRSLILGAMVLHGGDGDGIACRIEGALIRPGTEGTEALLMLRFIPKETAAEQFIALNQRIEELGKEVRRRREAEDEARRQEGHLLVTLQSIGDAVITTDTEGRVTMMNPVAEHLTAWQVDEATGSPLESVFNIVNEETRMAVENPALRALREGLIVGLANHTLLIARDGKERPIDDSAAPIRDAEGNIVGSVLVFRDITDRKLIEEQLREQKEWLRVTLGSIGDAVIATDTDSRVTFLNNVAQELTGWTQESAYGQTLENVFPIANEQTQQPVENPVEKVLREGGIVGLGNHTVLTARDGTVRPIDDSAAPIRDESGRMLGVVLIFRDVTEQRRAEEEIRRSAEQFRQLADAMPQIVWTARPEGEIDYLNRRWTDFSGLPETVGNEGWNLLMHPDDAPPAHERWAASVQSGDPFEMEMRLLDQQKNCYRWHLIRTVAAQDETGNVTRWFGTCTDIHEQKRSEETSRYLAEASASLAKVVDYESTLQKVANLAVPYFADWSAVDVANEDGTLRRLAVAHRDTEKISLAHELMRDYPPSPQSATGIFGVLRSGKPEIVSDITDELRVQWAKDERHLSIMRAMGLRSYICVPLIVSGNPLGVLTFATAESGRVYTDADLALSTDLAQRAGVAIENTQLYQALRETDRLKDEFLATLAHELRNPLAPIYNSLQLLKMRRIDSETVERSRDIMERQVRHLVRLVDDLLDVSRVMRGKIDLRREKVELATVVARAVETVQPLIDAQGHQLSVHLPPESLLIDADPVRLAQVIGNLLTNAAKYTEANGRIWLTAELDDNAAVLRVRDNGIGIAKNMLHRIFDLFVQVDHASTKAQGGLGIGLTLVKNLVGMHHGTIEARSEGLGRGSEFVVRLPISAQTEIDDHIPEAEQTPLPTTPSGYRLLIVDDNQDAAISLAVLLKLQGHEVQVAHSGPAALEMTKNYRPDVVFLDIGMPGMDGYEVARRLREQPGLEKVVLAALTGWGQREDRRRSTEAGFNFHLVKPLEPQALESVLAGLPKLCQ